PNNGGFFPDNLMKYLGTSLQNKYVYPEHAFYIIKSLDLLATFLGIGNVTDLPLDMDALTTYILHHRFENSTIFCFQPFYTNTTTEILKTTYYFTWILRILDRYDLNSTKIKNYLERVLNYENLENVYYSYKISQLLNLNLEFNYTALRALVTSLYSESQHEFLKTPSSSDVHHEYLAWLTEMAMNSPPKLHVIYSKTIPLEASNTLTAGYFNMVMLENRENITMKFESPQFGLIPLVKQPNGCHEAQIFIPYSSQNYPIISGMIKVYNNLEFQEEVEIFFNTTYEIEYQESHLKNSNNLLIYFNISIVTGFNTHDLSESFVHVNLSRNNVLIKTLQPNFTHQGNYSEYYLNYTVPEAGTYRFEIYIVNDFESSPIYLFTIKEIFMNILSPPPFEIFGENPPFFVLDVRIENLSKIWYTIENNLLTYPFIENGTINEPAWNTLDNGSIYITFHVNDTQGNQDDETIIINKNLSPPLINIINPADEKIHGQIAPHCEVEINSSLANAYLEDAWYVLDDGIHIRGPVYFENSSDIFISQNIWEEMNDGLINITFFANDSLGNLGTKMLKIYKDTTLPKISIIQPLQAELFHEQPPQFQIFIEELHVDSGWYFLSNGTYSSPFNYLNFSLFQNNGSQITHAGIIDQVSWNLFQNDTINIIFQVNDTAGNLDEEIVFVYKIIHYNTTQPTIIENTPKEESNPKNEEEQSLDTSLTNQSSIIGLSQIAFGLIFLISPCAIIGLSTILKKNRQK
ncbi:MAG: hypothetical protein ACTSU4_03570, partial [Promethearchaeota archaeon]